MIYLEGEHEIVSAYVSGQTGDPYANVVRSLGVLTDEGRIIGGFVFTRYTGHGVEVSLAGRGCIMREAWQRVGNIVFGELACQRLAVTTRRSNKRVCRLAPRLHFRFEGIARKYFGDEDGVSLSLLRSEAVQHGLWKEA